MDKVTIPLQTFKDYIRVYWHSGHLESAGQVERGQLTNKAGGARTVQDDRRGQGARLCERSQIIALLILVIMRAILIGSPQQLSSQGPGS